VTSLADRATDQLRPVTGAASELAAMFGAVWRRSLKVRVVIRRKIIGIEKK